MFLLVKNIILHEMAPHFVAQMTFFGSVILNFMPQRHLRADLLEMCLGFIFLTPQCYLTYFSKRSSMLIK